MYPLLVPDDLHEKPSQAPSTIWGTHPGCQKVHWILVVKKNTDPQSIRSMRENNVHQGIWCIQMQKHGSGGLIVGDTRQLWPGAVQWSKPYTHEPKLVGSYLGTSSIHGCKCRSPIGPKLPKWSQEAMDIRGSADECMHLYFPIIRAKLAQQTPRLRTGFLKCSHSWPA